MVQRHGGELDIRSEVGKGSSFRLVFPAARVRTGVEEAEAAPNLVLRGTDGIEAGEAGENRAGEAPEGRAFRTPDAALADGGRPR